MIQLHFQKQAFKNKCQIIKQWYNMKHNASKNMFSDLTLNFVPKESSNHDLKLLSKFRMITLLRSFLYTVI